MENRLEIRVKEDVVILPTISDLPIGKSAYVDLSNMKIVDIDGQRWDVLFNSNAPISYFQEADKEYLVVYKNQDASIDILDLPILASQKLTKSQYNKLRKEGWDIVTSEDARIIKILDLTSQYVIIMSAKEEIELLRAYFENVHQTNDIQKESAKVIEDIFVARVKQMSYAEVAVQLNLFHDELTAHLERAGRIPEEEDVISLQVSYSLFNSIQDIFWNKMPLLELKRIQNESIDPNAKKYFSHIIAMRTQN